MAISLSLGDVYVTLGLKSEDFKKNMKDSENALGATFSRMQSMAFKYSVAVTTPLTLLGREALKVFGDLDDELTTAEAIFGDTTQAMRKSMEDVAWSIATSSRTAVTDLAKGFQQLASTGQTVAQSLESIRIVEKFSVAGLVDMGKATRYLTTAQAALGLATKEPVQNMENMRRIANALVQANRMSTASVEDFATALTTKAAAAARQLNISVEQTIAILMAYAKQGIRAQLAGERTYMMLRDLQTATIKHNAVWKAAGIAVYDAAGNFRNISSILGDMERAMNGMNAQQQRDLLLKLKLQDRSVAAITALIGTSKEVKTFEEALKGSGNALDEVTNKRLTSFRSQMIRIQNVVEKFETSIGEVLAPALVSMGNSLEKLLYIFNSLDPTVKKIIVYMGVLAAVMGPVLLFVSTLVLFIGNLVNVLLVLIPLLTETAILLDVMAVAQIVAFAAAFVAGIDGILDALGAANLGLNRFIQNIRIGGYRIGTYLAVSFIWIKTKFVTVTEYMRYAWDVFSTSILHVWETVQSAIAMAMNATLGVVVGVLQKITDRYSKTIKGITGLGVNFGIITGEEAKALDSFFGADFADNMKGYFKEIQENSKDTAKTIREDWQANLKEIWEKSRKNRKNIEMDAEEERKFLYNVGVALFNEDLPEIAKRKAEAQIASAPTPENTEMTAAWPIGKAAGSFFSAQVASVLGGDESINLQTKQLSTMESIQENTKKMADNVTHNLVDTAGNYIIVK